MKVFCLPPHEDGQNPYYFHLKIWQSRAAAVAGFRKRKLTWGRDTLGYFVHYNGTRTPHCLGTVHLTEGLGFQLQILTHEMVHVAWAFAARHHAKHIDHCPFAIGDSEEECVAYLTGYLTEALIRRLTKEQRWALL